MKLIGANEFGELFTQLINIEIQNICLLNQMSWETHTQILKDWCSNKVTSLLDDLHSIKITSLYWKCNAQPIVFWKNKFLNKIFILRV